MERTIKFRGKRYGDGDWVYGNLYQGTTDGKQYSIILNDAGYHLAPQDDRNLAIAFAENEVNVVFTQTVGQFTGLLDKNGTEIYEGDIVHLDSWKPNAMQIKFIEAAFCLADENGEYLGDIHYIQHAQVNQCTVLGNIHDNLELLKGGAE